MYGGGIFLSGIETVDPAKVLADFSAREDGFTGAAIYSAASDFLLSSSFRCNRYVNCFRRRR